MSQVFAKLSGSPSPSQESLIDALPPLTQSLSTGSISEQEYESSRMSLLNSIDGTRVLLTSLNEQQEHWHMHYPHELGVSSHERAASVGPSRAELKRAASVPPEEPEHDEAHRPSLPVRSNTTIQPQKLEQPSKHPLSILSIDLRGSNHIVPSLSQATLGQFLARRFESATRHLDSLRARVQDRSSRILVTGDLNAGKSTFVNALLRRDLLPTDQQPCTNVFCEVLDAAKLNNGVEEVHAVRHADLDRYSVEVKETFQRFALKELEEVCMDGAEEFGLLKVYVNDTCDSHKVRGSGSSNSAAASRTSSFVNNGSVQIALIDAPGLNRDTLSTTALFARQSEIDIVVFVVSAENHFTLSAKEFLLDASREKAYVFVVVNKWAAIRDKVRCERIVGQQIQQLSPGTWESRSELVHFVEAADKSSENAAFENLESSLREFVLLKRAKSKLAPARHYVLNLLTDMGLLSDANLAAAEQQYREAEERLEVVRPIHERMLRQREEVSEGISAVEDTRVGEVQAHAKANIDRVVASLDQRDPALPQWLAWNDLWKWAAELKEALLAKVEEAVISEEEHARASAVDGVAEIKDGLGKKYLPDEQRQKDERVFRPDAMFARRRRHLKRPSVAGIGLSAGADVEISILDLVDFGKLLPIHRPHKAIQHAVEEDAATTLSAISVGVGAITMFGSRAVGIRSFVETVARVADALGSPKARKLAGPIVVALTGLLAWHIYCDLPNALPRNIARKLQAALAPPPGATDGDDQSYSAQQADRVSRELRKVLRLAGYDLSERFRAGLEDCEAQRNQIEASKRQAEESKRFFLHFGAQVDEQDAKARLLDLGNVAEA